MSLKAANLFDDDLLPDAKPASVGNVLPFEQSKDVRVQDIVLKMLLDGKGYEEIAGTVKRSASDVEKIARSEWARREITEQLKASPEASQRDTLQNLVRIQAFDAIQTLGKLLKSDHEGIRLQAAKLAIAYALPLPQKDLSKSGTALPSDPEKIKDEFNRVQREIEARKRPLAS